MKTATLGGLYYWFFAGDWRSGRLTSMGGRPGIREEVALLRDADGIEWAIPESQVFESPGGEH